MSGYPSEFNDELREKVKERDMYMCWNCGMTEQESMMEYGQTLSVHHKDEDKTNNSMDNLVTLCKGCHQRLHLMHDIVL